MDILEFIKKMQEMYGEDVITTANKIKRPDPKPIVKEIEAINEFVRRNPRAEGGMIGKPGGIVEPGVKYYGKYIPHSSPKDKVVLPADAIKKIKNKVKLPVGQKWDFYDPKTNPNGYTYGVRKAKYPKLWDMARNVGKPGRREKHIKESKEIYKKIKADPKLLAEKKLYDREIYLSKREKVLEDLKFKYATNKDFREGKLEWAKQDRIKNPEKHKKRLSEYYAKKGQFPNGNNYKEHVWRDMFRSSQKIGQERFLLVDESGKLLTRDNFPKVNGKVRWDVGAAYKKVKFYDTKTKQFVKFDDTIKGKGLSFEKYLDQKEVGGKGAFKNAIYGYKIKDDYKNLTFKDSKGKTISLGKFMQDQLIDGSDFIKSGINVQHADLNNAFWKNEVSLASSNIELKNLESNVERDLRAANKIDDVKLKNIAKNKALGTFKKEIEKLPGGITKVIEGTTYGIKPTERGLIRAAGKEFGATRYKDFANLLKKLCPKGQASGGRIGYQDAGAVGKTLQCGSKRLEQILLKGGANKNEQVLAKQILRAGAGLKSMLSLKGFLGPAALAFTAATDAGIVGYDMLAEGKTFKEAVGDSVFNYALGPKLKIDSIEERNKRFRKLGVSEKDMGKIAAYESALGDIDRIENIFAKNQTTKQKLEEAKKFFPAVVDKRQKEVDAVRADIQDLARTGTEQRLMNVDYDAGAKALEEAKKLATIDRLTSRGPQIFGQIFPKAEKSRQQRILDASSIVNPAHNIPGMREATGGYLYGFASGGLANLTNTIPPESGPMSQGLRSLYNNGKKL